MKIGTSVYGIRLPIISKNENLVETILNSLDFDLIEDNDIIGVTESIVARAENNYATLSDIAADVKEKIGKGPIGLVFPIFSRNRFLPILKAFSMGVDELIIQMSFPKDEVGNPLFNEMKLLNKPQIDLHHSIFSEEEFKEIFGEDFIHPFTNVDYVELYKKVNSNIKIIFSNDPKAILKYTKKIICGNIHDRNKTKQELLRSGAEKVITIADIANSPSTGGFNSEFGLLGSNYSTEDTLKLFPNNGENFVKSLQEALYAKTNKNVHVLIYGDGAFKDPAHGIWELADPVVSPAYTPDLIGSLNEIKLKQIRDEHDFSSSEEVKEYMLKNKNKSTNDLGTTPRRLTDLLGSLCDLVSGSGDKGTPVVLIKDYFKDYSEN
jgi:F420-0:gamma-glutamyl ligase